MKKRSRNLTYPFVIIGFLSILTNSCTKDDEKDYQPPSIVATERWDVEKGDGTLYNSYHTFTKKSDGSITTSGTWVFQKINCTYRKAVVSISNTVFSFTATGTAKNPDLPVGQNTSPFKLYAEFTTHNGTSVGGWTLSFTVKDGWPTELDGGFVGMRSSGSGVTF